MRWLKRTSLFTCGLLLLGWLVMTGASPAQKAAAKAPALPVSFLAKPAPEVFAGLRARSIGPANMSGRVSALDAVAADPKIIYVGAASGGVWKSEDGGISWRPVFDDQPDHSIGAIAIDQSNPSIVWVGTGESFIRNSVSIGRGVYVTRDGAKTWQRVGLEKTEKISDILVHPNDSNTVYVGALGATWGDSPERGVYKTTDSGRTWKKILYVNEKTGVADMAMDPSNPNKIFVAMWEHRRWPWFFKSGGPGSGLYVTTDGGETWKKLTDKEGLPKGELGRIAIAIAPSRPSVVYALVEAEKNCLLRSNDGGATWSVVNDESGIHPRPFYYSRIYVNPVNENILYIMGTTLRVSEDGGRTVQPLIRGGQAHSDHHVMWIHPDGEMMIVGNDGGVVISYNRGNNWRYCENLPVGQFYHIAYDMEVPYNVYGGLQDNGSWRGAAYSLTDRGVMMYHWITVGGGDGFDVQPDPEDSKCGYGMSQGGNLYYYDIRTGSSRPCVPTESDVRHRYNWNAGIALDPFDPKTVYYGSQFLHRSRDKGRSWEIISPDLTTNDPEKQKQNESGGLTLDITGAENHCTILSIAPSPKQQGVIWVGTDDGNVQLTRDGGKTWELVSKNFTSGKTALAPAGGTIPHIKASRHDAATAYVVYDDHQRSNFQPYLFVTRDFGKTWKNLATSEIDGWCKAIEEDPVNPNLLFLGTEFGLYVSFNGGSSWMKWTHGLPPVPVFDLAVHPRDNDLLIATHGRSIYIIDDITPLRELSEEIVKKRIHLFSMKEAIQWQLGRMSSYQTMGDAEFTGQNKNLDAGITYFLNPVERKPEEVQAEQARLEQARQQMLQRAQQMGFAGMMAGGQFPFGQRAGAATSTRVSITIEDSSGKVVARMNGTENRGINRVFWNMRESAPGEEPGQPPAAFGFGLGAAGIAVLPGIYTVKIRYEGEEVSQKFEVKPDPRYKVDLEVLKKNYEMAKEAQELTRTVQSAQRQIQDTQRAVQTVRDFARFNRSPKMKEVLDAAKVLEEKLKKLSETLSPTPTRQGGGRGESLMAQVTSAVGGIIRAGYEPITEPALVRYEKAKKALDNFLAEFNQVFEKDVENFKKLVQEAGFTLFAPFTPLKVK
ncbi:MAG: VPS10 domain-containing protein [Candidatus Aminicenantales bacterium]